MAQTQYTEENIRSLDWKEHIRMRPGMYIGKLGDGSSHDDGIYILLKEVIDNCIDEFVMGAGKTIEISIKEDRVTVRDHGRGIPLGKVVDVVSKMNTGGKEENSCRRNSSRRLPASGARRSLSSRMIKYSRSSGTATNMLSGCCGITSI